jgi:hypothetical protein
MSNRGECPDCIDRIEAQAAEIAQLKERVKELEYEVQCAYEDMAGENI